MKLVGLVTGGKLSTGIWQDALKAVAELDGKRVSVSIAEVKPKRSRNQNAYYWGVVVEAVTQMFRDAGNYVDADDVHDYLKMRVGKLAQVIVTPDGEVTKSLGSTSKLSKPEFEVYVEKIRAWAAEYGCTIPLPNENINQLG